MALIFTEEDRQLLQECVHCGLCLPTCPTYMVNGKEADSPRGRLALMKALDEGAIEDQSGAWGHIDLCLGCRACEPVCPSGVQYGRLLEATRAGQWQEAEQGNRLTRLALNWIARPERLKWFTRLLRMKQRVGAFRLAQTLRLGRRSWRLQLAGLPAMPRQAFSARQPAFSPAMEGAPYQGAVALFTGCVMDHWYGRVHAATVRTLRWNGFDVTMPPRQGCCGALHAHAGWAQEGDRLLEANRKVFAGLEVEAVIVNAAGCGSRLAEHLSGGPEGDLPPAVDVAAWLANRLQRSPAEKLSERMAYDAPCHLQHALGVRSEPLALLRAACEELTPLPDAEVCCGSAGLYALQQGEMSGRVLERKMEAIQELGVKRLVTGNPGCQMQLQAGLRRAGLPVPVSHTIEVLDEAYGLNAAYRRAFNLPD